jgi:hypothetical protein
MKRAAASEENRRRRPQRVGRLASYRYKMNATQKRRHAADAISKLATPSPSVSPDNTAEELQFAGCPMEVLAADEAEALVAATFALASIPPRSIRSP